MRLVAALLLSPALLTAPLAARTSSGAEPSGPEGAGFCFTNLQGLGICQSAFQLCPVSGECDAATPCPDGKVCTVGTACESKLAGVCLTALEDGGCSNPGTYQGGFEPCVPVLFHEDFNNPIIATPEGGPPPDLDQLARTTVCGSGSNLFKELSCTANAGASSPLETARWGVTPGACSTYATAAVRLVAATGPIDVSECARAQLDFDYTIRLNEGGGYDRVFVTVGAGILFGPEGVGPPYEPLLATNQISGEQAFTVSALSCAGSVLPVGKLVQDSAWHHFRAPLGEGPVVEVKLWAETVDEIDNSGQGWFFDDVRIDCSDLIFDEGFEGGNLLLWSFTTAPPLLVEVFVDGSCKGYSDCGGPGSGCLNFTSAEGPAYCLSDFSCFNDGCVDSSDCAAGERCIVDSCCAFATCAPAHCTPGTSIFDFAAATAAGG